MRSACILVFVLAAGTLNLFAQSAKPRFQDLVGEFEYDARAALHVREVVRERRNGTTIIDLNYASPKGGRVPAYLVVPNGRGPFAAILYGHWMMEGSPLRNRRQFLDEAAALAPAGVVALMIDAPLVRPGITEEKDELKFAAQSAQATRQQVIDFRRGLDLLLLRSDVDPKRIAFVGHSFDAQVGAILSAVEKRISSFVLMAGGYALEEYVFDETNEDMRKLRSRIGDEKIREHFRNHAWNDPVHFIGHSAPAAVFLQFGREDSPIPPRLAMHYYAMFADPKRIGFYDCGHALNAKARVDRVEWLRRRLSLGVIDQNALTRIPDLK